MSLVFERSRRIPLFFEIYSVSILDVVTLKRTVQSIKDTMPKIEIILDKGFFSHENLDLLRDHSYIIAASLASKAIMNVFPTASRTFDSADNVLMYNHCICELPEPKLWMCLLVSNCIHSASLTA